MDNQKNNTKLIIIIVSIILLVALGGGYYYLRSNKSDNINTMINKKDAKNENSDVFKDDKDDIVKEDVKRDILISTDILEKIFNDNKKDEYIAYVEKIIYGIDLRSLIDFNKEKEIFSYFKIFKDSSESEKEKMNPIWKYAGSSWHISLYIKVPIPENKKEEIEKYSNDRHMLLFFTQIWDSWYMDPSSIFKFKDDVKI